MAKDLHCPNCGPDHKLVWKDNGDCVCPTCNGTFHPGPEPKLVGIGEFDELKGKVTKLEADNAELRELLKGKSTATEATADADDEEEDFI